MESTVLAITGHRLNKLAKFGNLQQRLEEKLAELRPQLLISGMAVGVDQIAARVAINMGIPVWACIPCLGQDSVWYPETKRNYRWLLDRCQKITIVTEQPYHLHLNVWKPCLFKARTSSGFNRRQS